MLPEPDVTSIHIPVSSFTPPVPRVFRILKLSGTKQKGLVEEYVANSTADRATPHSADHADRASSGKMVRLVGCGMALEHLEMILCGTPLHGTWSFGSMALAPPTRSRINGWSSSSQGVQFGDPSLWTACAPQMILTPAQLGCFPVSSCGLKKEYPKIPHCHCETRTSHTPCIGSYLNISYWLRRSRLCEKLGVYRNMSTCTAAQALLSHSLPPSAVHPNRFCIIGSRIHI